MKYQIVAVVLVVVQITFAVLVAALDYTTRARQRASQEGSSGRGESAAAEVAEARGILSAAPSTADVTAAIRRARSPETTQALVAYAANRVPLGEREALGVALHTEPRVRRILDGARSPLWWKRLAAARILALIADESDLPAIRRLLSDTHPAVQSAAAACLGRHVDEELLMRMIDGLSSASSAVRAYQLGVLSQHGKLAAPLLLERIRADAPPHKLYAYVHAVAALDDTECMAKVAELSTHAHPEVRVAVARVLRSTPGDPFHIKLLSMLRDSDWRVRAQAARGLGTLSDPATVQELVRALTDPTWWVRFRAGLALAGMAEAGREALEAARGHPDRYARDMAVLVSGLSAASVTELSAG